MLVVGCGVAAEAVAAFAAVVADTRTCFGFVAVGLFQGRLCGEVLGLCRSGLPPTCSCPPEAAAKAMTAMLVGSLGKYAEASVEGCIWVAFSAGNIGQYCWWPVV